MTTQMSALDDHRKRLRAKYGVRCPNCATTRPKEHAPVLLPQEACTIDGYIDLRPELTNQEWCDV